MTDTLTVEPRLATISRFDAFEASVASRPQAALTLVHHFADGTYGRELTIPAGCDLTGKEHRFSCLNFIPRGRIRVYTAEGGVREIVGPAWFISPAGTRRAGHAIEETVWITVHPNADNTNDLDLIESRLIEPRALPVIESALMLAMELDPET